MGFKLILRHYSKKKFKQVKKPKKVKKPKVGRCRLTLSKPG